MSATEARRYGMPRADFEENAMARWPDNDVRWARMYDTYCLLHALADDEIVADQPLFAEAGAAALELVEKLIFAFNIDDKAGDQFARYADCRRAAATITRNLDALLAQAQR